MPMGRKKFIKMKILVICSGGLDSVSMALRYIGENEVTLLSFRYGQKATKEIEVPQLLAQKYEGVKYQEIDISSFSSIFGETQLTGKEEVQNSYTPSVVVPLRNALFLQIAMIIAYSQGYDKVVLGSHLDDCTLINGEYAFPDCTPDFFKAFELAMRLGTFRTDKRVEIETASLLGLHKTDLIRQAYQKDSDILFRTWSCYKNGEHQCGACDSCQNRKAAFKAAGIEDKTEYDV